MLRNAKYLDCQYGEDTKNRLLSYLFKTLRDKYINEGGQVKEKYLICNTKKSDRETIVVFIKGLFNNEKDPCMEYIQGTCEINEMLEEIDKELESCLDNSFQIYEQKRETKTAKMFWKLRKLMKLIDNVNKTIKDDLEVSIQKDSKVSIVAA